jgi:hypothetical protein
VALVSGLVVAQTGADMADLTDVAETMMLAAVLVFVALVVIVCAYLRVV